MVRNKRPSKNSHFSPGEHTLTHTVTHTHTHTREHHFIRTGILSSRFSQLKSLQETSIMPRGNAQGAEYFKCLGGAFTLTLVSRFVSERIFLFFFLSQCVHFSPNQTTADLLNNTAAHKHTDTRAFTTTSFVAPGSSGGGEN